MLSVRATGTEPLTYQWFKDEVAISGATSRMHVLANIQSSDAGVYGVTVSNEVGSARSADATVTVLPAKVPSFIAGPLINPANGHAYYLLEQSTWVEAEAGAQALGGHLTTLRSAAEQDWVVTEFGAWDGQERNLWIGLRDPDPLNNASNSLERRIEFVWTSGEPVTYLNWNVSEPDNYQELGEYYVHTLSQSEPTGANTWNDAWDTDFNEKPLHGLAEVIIRRLTAGTRTGDGQFQFVGLGPPGEAYLLQASTNLVHWEIIGTITNASGTTQIQDDATTFSQRFYRLVLQ
jgi:hypothetical protein